MAEKRTTKKTVKTEEASTTPPAVKPEKTVEEKPRSRWSVDSLFWGLLLVVIGGLLLLGNLGVLDINWFELWRLWPLLIVAAGFSVLATSHWAWKLLSVLFIVGALGIVVLVAVGGYEPNGGRVEQHESSIQLEGNVQQTEVEIKAGASSLNITSEDTDELVAAKLGGKGLRLEKNSHMSGGTQYVKLASKRDHAWWIGPHTNEWDIVLSERVPMKLSIDAGASSTNADLSKLNLTSLKLEAGASSTDLTLGSKAVSTKVIVEAGASSLKIRVPKNSGVSLKFDGGLSSKDIADLKETGEGTYQTDGFDTATNRIEIEVDAGLTSFTIERY